MQLYVSSPDKSDLRDVCLPFHSGVAVGSSIGHAIGGMFGGGSSAPAEQQQADNTVANQSNDGGYQSNTWGPRSCETDAKTFTKCMDENQGNMQICGWYLDQLVPRVTILPQAVDWIC